MDDTISRQDAIMAVKMGALSAATLYGRTDEGSTALYDTVRAIKAIPSAQPEPCEDDAKRTSANYYSGRLKNDDHKAVEILDWFTKAFCIDAEAGNDLVFRCPECLFQMIDGTCLVKAFKHKFYPDYKDFGSMGDL